MRTILISVLCLLASALCFSPSALAQNKGNGGKAKKVGAAKIPGTENLDKGAPANFHRLALGDKAPDFSLPGTDGKTHTLADFASCPSSWSSSSPTTAPTRTQPRRESSPSPPR